MIGKKSAVEVGNHCRIEANVIFSAYHGPIKLGEHTSVQANCLLHGSGGLSIGSNVMIAAGCVFIPFSHVIDRVDIPMRAQGLTMKGIVIEDDVWLGAGVNVLDGARIGHGAVIGAGAVVTGEIPPYAVAVGVPAQVIRYRNETEQQNRRDEHA